MREKPKYVHLCYSRWPYSCAPTVSQISVLSVLDADDVAAETDIISPPAKKRNIFKLRNEVWDREPVLVCLLCLILIRRNECFYCKKNNKKTCQIQCKKVSDIP